MSHILYGRNLWLKPSVSNYVSAGLLDSWYSSQHETLTQCCISAGPPSATLAQHQPNIPRTFSSDVIGQDVASNHYILGLQEETKRTCVARRVWGASVAARSAAAQPPPAPPRRNETGRKLQGKDDHVGVICRGGAQQKRSLVYASPLPCPQGVRGA